MARNVNSYGCLPSEDVCLQHDEPLVNRYKCEKGTNLNTYVPQALRLTDEQAKALVEEGRRAAAEYTKRCKGMHGPVEMDYKHAAMERAAWRLHDRFAALQQEMAIWKLAHFWGVIFRDILVATPCACGHQYHWSGECWEGNECNCPCYQADLSKSPTNQQG